MVGEQDRAREAQWAKWRSVADLYHAYFTGLVLTVVSRRGTADAAEFVFRVFRRQQQERFLPGLVKLGLDHLPPAVAAILGAMQVSGSGDLANCIMSDFSPASRNSASPIRRMRSPPRSITISATRSAA